MDGLWRRGCLSDGWIHVWWMNLGLCVEAIGLSLVSRGWIYSDDEMISLGLFTVSENAWGGYDGMISAAAVGIVGVAVGGGGKMIVLSFLWWPSGWCY